MFNRVQNTHVQIFFALVTNLVLLLVTQRHCKYETNKSFNNYPKPIVMGEDRYQIEESSYDAHIKRIQLMLQTQIGDRMPLSMKTACATSSARIGRDAGIVVAGPVHRFRRP
jgi:hypothetical protein